MEQTATTTSCAGGGGRASQGPDQFFSFFSNHGLYYFDTITRHHPQHFFFVKWGMMITAVAYKVVLLYKRSLSTLCLETATRRKSNKKYISANKKETARKAVENPPFRAIVALVQGKSCKSVVVQQHKVQKTGMNRKARAGKKKHAKRRRELKRRMSG